MRIDVHDFLEAGPIKFLMVPFARCAGCAHHHMTAVELQQLFPLHAYHAPSTASDRPFQ